MGKLVVIEGIDGSGKNTQAKKIVEMLTAKGFKVATMSFPDYNSFFGKEVANYLNGDFGELKNLHPKLIAMLYSGDRFLSKEKLKNLIDNHDFTILDRYTSSNTAHQASKISDPQERDALIDWIVELEYVHYGLPKPDATIFLNVPPFFSDKLVLKKDVRSYTEKKKDLHEADKNHLLHAYGSYMALAVKEPNWHLIECVRNNELKAIDEIASDLVEKILSI